MSFESQVAALVATTQELTVQVAGKMVQINAQVASKIAELDAWKAAASPEKRITTEITIGGSKDFFYPMWWRSRGSGAEGTHRLTIHRPYHLDGDDSKRPLNPAGPHQAGLLLELEIGDCAVGGDPKFFDIKRFGETYNRTIANLGYQFPGHQYRIDPAGLAFNGVADGVTSPCGFICGLYLRGGGLTYKITTNQDLYLFGYHNGATQAPVEVCRVPEINTRWLVAPLPFADGVAPTIDLSAFTVPA